MFAVRGMTKKYDGIRNKLAVDSHLFSELDLRGIEQACRKYAITTAAVSAISSGSAPSPAPAASGAAAPDGNPPADDKKGGKRTGGGDPVPYPPAKRPKGSAITACVENCEKQCCVCHNGHSLLNCGFLFRKGLIVEKNPEEAAKRLAALELKGGKQGETPPATSTQPPGTPPSCSSAAPLTPSEPPPTQPPPTNESVLGVDTTDDATVKAAMAEFFASDSDEERSLSDGERKFSTTEIDYGDSDGETDPPRPAVPSPTAGAEGAAGTKASSAINDSSPVVPYLSTHAGSHASSAAVTPRRFHPIPGVPRTLHTIPEEMSPQDTTDSAPSPLPEGRIVDLDPAPRPRACDPEHEFWLLHQGSC